MPHLARTTCPASVETSASTLPISWMARTRPDPRPRSGRPPRRSRTGGRHAPSAHPPGRGSRARARSARRSRSPRPGRAATAPGPGLASPDPMPRGRSATSTSSVTAARPSTTPATGSRSAGGRRRSHAKARPVTAMATTRASAPVPIELASTVLSGAPASVHWTAMTATVPIAAAVHADHGHADDRREGSVATAKATNAAPTRAARATVEEPARHGRWQRVGRLASRPRSSPVVRMAQPRRRRHRRRQPHARRPMTRSARRPCRHRPRAPVRATVSWSGRPATGLDRPGGMIDAGRCRGP